MSSLNDKLLLIKDARDDIKGALEDKGQVVGNDIRDYATAIDNITTGAKVFSSSQQMQQDVNAKEGDLAIIISDVLSSCTVDSHFSSATFPQTVVLDEQLEDYINLNFRAVDTSMMFDAYGQLSGDGLSLSCYSDNGSYSVEYTSQDGITFTRTTLEDPSGSVSGDVLDFEVEICYSQVEYWNDIIGNFIKVNVTNFNGLYEGIPVADDSKYYLHNVEYDTINNNINVTVVENEYMSSTIFNSFVQAIETYTSDTYSDMLIFMNKLKTDIVAYAYINNTNQLADAPDRVCHWDEYFFIPVSSTEPIKKYTYNIAQGTITVVDCSIVMSLPVFSATKSSCTVLDDNYYIGKISILDGTIDRGTYTFIDVQDVSKAPYTSPNTLTEYKVATPTKIQYTLMSTQLNASSDYVFEKTFYGKNGTEVGSMQNVTNLSLDELKTKVNLLNTMYDLGIQSSITSLASAFAYNEDIKIIPNIDITNVTEMNNICSGCTSLTEIPKWDYNGVVNMQAAFSGCTSITELPSIDLSTVKYPASIVSSCTNLVKTAEEYDMTACVNAQSMFGSTGIVTAPRLINITSAKWLDSMFASCTNLVNVPEYNIPNVETMNRMFYDCTNLSDDSLNNIMAMCVTATKIATNNKKLSYLSLTSTQANKCKTLSNYSAFTSAGWTTGY